MKNITLLFFVLLFLGANHTVWSAPAYAFRVVFKDKNGTKSFSDSLTFLSSKSLARRNKQGIALDSTDLPVVKAYIDTTMATANAVMLHNVSKWFNQIVVITYDSSKAADIALLPMVSSVKLVARYASGIYKIDGGSSAKYPSPTLTSQKTSGSSAYYGLSFQQIDMIQADCLHDLGFKGENMDIAVLDVNFRFTDTCDAFDTLNIQNRIKDTWSFVKDTSYVFSKTIFNDHGMNVLSAMAGNSPGNYVGSAPHANFHLYITEDVASEQPIEEDNWLSAAERADSVGVDLLNSSVGYNLFDPPHTSYNYSKMDGNTTLIAKALNKAVAKGIFVVQAQGNEGVSSWQYMITPADADSSYSVGSVDAAGAWGQSGKGPTFDGQIKPDGVGVGIGVVIIGGNCLPGSTGGSSFAAPTLCGAIACLWQSKPELTVWNLRDIVRKNSSLYAAPNNTLGFGIPNFCDAYYAALTTPSAEKGNSHCTIYPNPIKGMFTISLDKELGPYSYSIVDAVGKKIYQSPLNLIGNMQCSSLASQPSGVYFLQITTKNDMIKKKLIVE